MKLNLGCGEQHLDGYVNVDLQACADLVADVRALPLPDQSVSKIVAFDILEHFWREHTDAVLGEWLRVLAPGGHLVLRVPNLTRLGEMLATDLDTHRAVENVYGGHRYGPDGSWDQHHWGWTRPGFERYLVSRGLLGVVIDNEPNMTASGWV